MTDPDPTKDITLTLQIIYNFNIFRTFWTNKIQNNANNFILIQIDIAKDIFEIKSLDSNDSLKSIKIGDNL
jgi:hypothetical protein